MWAKNHNMDINIASTPYGLFESNQSGQGQADVAYLYQVLKGK